MMVGAVLNYSPIENIYLALIFALQKLRHYLLTMMIHLISRVNPLKYIMSHPSVQGCIAKWTILLSKFDIHYVPQRAIKGQALVDFLATHLVPNVMFFDGASRGPSSALRDNMDVLRDRHCLHHPRQWHHMLSLTLTEGHSNNETKYKVLITGLELALEILIDDVMVYKDLELIVL